MNIEGAGAGAGGRLSALTAWVRHRVICYLSGRGVIFGADGEILPRKATIPGKYALYGDALPLPIGGFCDGNFEVLANGVFDFVFLGRRMELAGEGLENLLKDATKKLRVGGHLIVFSQITGTGAFSPGLMKQLVGKVGKWLVKDTYVKDGHLLQVYKLLGGKSAGLETRAATTKPRACVVRYGAMGDMIMLTPLLRRLHEDGFEVTLNISPYSAPVIKHNPFVDNIVIQEKEAIPNHTLGEYWKEWQGDYDRYINLSESIEGRLLKVEGRREFFTSQEWRERECGKNYYDFTMERGGYPDATGLRGELYFSRSEIKEARWFREKFKDKKMVLWALNGSSHHKKYAPFQAVLTDYLEQRPEVMVVTVGDERAQAYEFDHKQLVRGAGQWGIRQSLALTSVVDAVVGPESVMVNAAGCFGTPKVTFLSHSTHENLCKYWENDFCLAPDKRVAQCYPCHQLHYSEGSCPILEVLDEGGQPLGHGPACSMGAVSGEAVQRRLDEALAVGYSPPE